MKPQQLQHLGIILDGNRRFAKKLMMQPWKGHELGAEKVEKLLDYAKELGIKQMTLYCLSIENINSRPKNELEFLFKLFRKEFRGLSREKIHKNKIKIRFIGRLKLLPKNLREQCLELEKQTKSYKELTVNFALAYGGQQEIVDAVKKIISNKLPPGKINEKTIKQNLYINDEPDLIIRTGGEKRTSNFLPFQSVYSEWCFTDKMWPEFDKKDLKKAIKEFEARGRRFGK